MKLLHSTLSEITPSYKFQIEPQMLQKRMPSTKMTPNIHGTSYGGMQLLRLDQKPWTYLGQRPKMRYLT